MYGKQDVFKIDDMNVESFAQQIQSIHWRIAEIYEGANTSTIPQIELLPSAFKELGVASEALQVASEELMQQTEELLLTRSHLEAQHLHYKELFEFLPLGYLVSDPEGKIQEANFAAARLFQVNLSKLPGKELINFVPLPKRPEFRLQLKYLNQGNWIQEWRTTIECSQGQLIDLVVSIVPFCDIEGKLINLHWILRTIINPKQVLRTLATDHKDIYHGRYRHFYTKGEIIPLEPQTIWLVHQGLVKLTTISETAEEILIGLASPSLPFSSCWTSLPTYQAISLSDNLELVSISLSEVNASADLAQALLPKVCERMRQTESLLAVAGRRQVKERLYYLLLWLKQEIGQPVPEGVKLKVRLTHQDLANACCTTRVTITRLLGKLQQQGKIRIDSKNYIHLID